MTARPPVRRTYGRRPPPPSSPPSLAFASSSVGSLVFTPPPPSSSPTTARRKRVRQQSVEASDDDDDDDDESPLFSSPTKGKGKSSIRTPTPMLVASAPSAPPSPLAAMDTNTALSTATRQTSLKGFFVPLAKRARPTPMPSSNVATTATSTTRSSSTPTPAAQPKPKLHQLQFTAGALRSCAECGMSYLRGSDDAEHARHHARVTRGIPWTARTRAVVDRVPLVPKASTSSTPTRTSPRRKAVNKTGNARIVIVDCAASASTSSSSSSSSTSTAPAARITEILGMVDTVVAAPALPLAIKDRCKLVLALTSDPPPSGLRLPGRPVEKGERVVGAVVVQPIKWAMRVLRDGESGVGGSVDSGGGVVCDPARLPTPLGIHRLFVVPAYRGLGLAREMLDVAAAETVYGCEFDPTKGQVAFSQPTDSGRMVMESWGKGGVRVFVDDESQL